MHIILYVLMHAEGRRGWKIWRETARERVVQFYTTESTPMIDIQSFILLLIRNE